MLKYLIQEERDKRIKRYLSDKQLYKTGPGAPDPEIDEWFDKLNTFSSICTTYSCTGHKKGNHENKVPGIGCIKFITNYDAFNITIKLAEKLPTTIYFSMQLNREIVDCFYEFTLRFHGLDYNKESFDKNIEEIHKFFEKISFEIVFETLKSRRQATRKSSKWG